MVRLKNLNGRLDIIPWFVIAKAAKAKEMMNRYPEDHPVHKKFKEEYDALARFSREILGPEKSAAIKRGRRRYRRRHVRR